MRRLVQKAKRVLTDYGVRGVAGKTLLFLAREIFPAVAEVKALDRLEEARPCEVALTAADGVVPSQRPPNEADLAFEVPFGPAIQAGSSRFDGAIAAIVHIFHLSLAEELRSYLENIPCRFDVFVSTDTAEKKASIERVFRGFERGSVEVRVFPNRGRDIAPKLVGFADVYPRYELFVHLHSKLSPHGGEGLVRWRAYLLDTILGSPEIVRSILSIFERTDAGIVFPQHYFPIRGILNWGYDYPLAKNLLARAGIELSKLNLLEFPSGSMFWGRSAALRPLLDLKLRFEDFDEERGQVDGTLAHAIERSLLFIAESAGATWSKIALRGEYPLPDTLRRVERGEDLAKGYDAVFRPVLGSMPTLPTAVTHAVAEMKPLLAHRSTRSRPRLSLLVPTLNPSQVFGGVATAVRVFADLRRELGGDFDYRLVVTDARIQPEAFGRYPEFAPVPLGTADPDAACTLVDASEREAAPLPVRAGEIFLATAWWTAHHADRLLEVQRRAFGRRMPLLYLIQDYEPDFYGWSTRWALAEATYRERAGETIGLINSEELFEYFSGRYRFGASYCLPYSIHPALAPLHASENGPRARNLIFYGRPSVARNCFEVLTDALFLWQQRDPVTASRWTVHSLGEDYPGSWCRNVANLRVLGKLDLDSYAQALRRAAVGVSLMVSPHPSYPPLEMALNGLWTVTNRYENKDLSASFPNVLSVETVTPSAVADAIGRAVARAEERGLVAPEVTTAPRGHLADQARYRPALLARRLREAVAPPANPRPAEQARRRAAAGASRRRR